MSIFDEIKLKRRAIFILSMKIRCFEGVFAEIEGVELPSANKG